MSIYIASKACHWKRWQELRAAGAPIISTWIDEGAIGATSSFSDLWQRCVSEAASCSALICYAEEGEILKGALVEIGVALASGRPVYIVGPVSATFCHHPLVRQCEDMEEALSFALFAPEPAREGKGMGVLNSLAAECHAANEKWWRDPATGERIERNKGELLMLVVSELAEAMEGERRGLMDEHLPHRRSVEVEMADALIRIFDYAGAFGLDLDGAVAEKRAFNATRIDHSFGARLRAGGKMW